METYAPQAVTEFRWNCATHWKPHEVPGESLVPLDTFKRLRGAALPTGRLFRTRVDYPTREEAMGDLEHALEN